MCQFFPLRFEKLQKGTAGTSYCEKVSQVFEVCFCHFAALQLGYLCWIVYTIWNFSGFIKVKRWFTVIVPFTYAHTEAGRAVIQGINKTTRRIVEPILVLLGEGTHKSIHRGDLWRKRWSKKKRKIKYLTWPTQFLLNLKKKLKFAANKTAGVFQLPFFSH